MYRPGNFLLCSLLAYALLLGACAGTKPQAFAPLSPENTATEDCPGIYLFAASRYSIGLVAGKQIVVDRPVPVYCTPQKARMALEEARTGGKVPASMELLVYLLDGEWRDMVRKDGDNYFLNKPAQLLDTVE